MIDSSGAAPTNPVVPYVGARAAGRRRIGLWYALVMAGILAGAALLRVAGLGFGLPHLYHWDEKMYYHGAFYALATGGHTESLVYGNVPYMLIPVLCAVSFLLGPTGLGPMVTRYLSDPTPYYLAGRLLWVALQIVGIALVYFIGRRAFSPRAALAATLFMSVAFLAVSEGHYVKGDSTAALGAVLSAWVALKLLDRPNILHYSLLGVAIGLSVAFKAYTYLLVVLPLIVHLLAWGDWKLRRDKAWLLLFAYVSALVGLVVALPAPLLDPAGTWEAFVIESGIPLASVPTGGVPVWLYYWTSHLPEGIGWPLYLAGLAGFGLWIYRHDRQRLLLLTMPVLLWIGLVTRSNGFARYALPVVPFLALAAGDALDQGASKVTAWVAGREGTRRFGATPVTVTFMAVALLLGMPTLLDSIRFDVYTASPDTRTEAAAWIEHNLPAGSSIVEDGGQGFEATSTLGVPLRPSPAAVGVTWAPTSLRAPTEYWSAPLLSWLQTYTPTYRLTFAPSITRRAEITSTAQWGSPDAFVLIGWRNNPEQNFPPSPIWDDLHANYDLAARFPCSPCFPDDPYAFSVDYKVLRQVDVLGRNTVSGPTVWVYRRK